MSKREPVRARLSWCDERPDFVQLGLAFAPHRLTVYRRLRSTAAASQWETKPSKAIIPNQHAPWWRTRGTGKAAIAAIDAHTAEPFIAARGWPTMLITFLGMRLLMGAVAYLPARRVSRPIRSLRGPRARSAAARDAGSMIGPVTRPEI